MSKIKLKSNDNGTGVISVESPNTNTDRTLTFPDSTGTLATTADSVGGANGVDFNDNVKARFGTGNDFAIWHDGTHTRLQNDTGNINIRADVFNVTKSDDSEDVIVANADGDIKLYRNNVIHLETLATGVRVPVGGVLFGTDTASANALDDYEEGTFTGTFKDSSGANMNGAVYTTYTKIGNLCTITVYNASWSDVQNGMLEQMTGLPFTAAASVRTVGSLGSYGAPLQDYAQFPVIYPNASSVQFKGSRDNNSWVSHWDVDSNSEFMWTMTYKTA